MKFSGAVLLSGAALSAAQSLGDLPACGQLCINNMIGIAQNQFGCPAGNATCYCSNKNFGLGVRDCSNQACPNSQQAQSAIAYEFAYCASALSAGGGSGGNGGSSTTTSGGSATGMSSMVSTTTVGGGNGGNGGALASATSHISAVKASPGVFVVGPGHTISAGGPVYSSNNGYVYTAQRSDVLVSGSGPSQLATVVPSAVFTTALSSGSSSASASNGGAGGAGGALAGATSGISSVSGTMGEYVVASSHTISNGGKGFTTDGTAYSAVQTGVVIAAKGQTTTYAATGGSGMGNGGGKNGGNGGGAAGLAGATKGISAVSGTKGEYVVASTHTISAGGNGFTTAGTMYTAVQTGVVIAAKGATTTYATTAGGSGGGAGGAGGMSSGMSGGMSASMSSTSSQSGFAAPAFATAAPGLIGAAALAVLAL